MEAIIKKSEFRMALAYLIFVTMSQMGYVDKICQVEKFQIFIHDRCGDIWNLSTCHLEICQISQLLHMWRNFKFLHTQHNYLQFTLFCRKSVLLRFTRFCVEKIEPKTEYVEKKDKYQVWTSVIIFPVLSQNRLIKG